MKHSQRMFEFEWIAFVWISWGVWSMFCYLCVFLSFSPIRIHVRGDCCVAYFVCWILVGRSILPFLLLLYLWPEIPRIYIVTCKYSNAHNGIVSQMDTQTQNAVRITTFVGFMDVNRCTKFNYIHFSCDANTSRQAQ